MSSTADDRPTTHEDEGTTILIGIGDGVWEDLSQPVDNMGSIERIALLPFGTRDGNPTVEVLIRLFDGRLVHANTTWRLWQETTRAFAESDESGGL
jgi:hypothetical protein